MIEPIIEKKHSDPKAFTPLENDGWQKVSRFERDFDFRRYKYRIFGEVYHRRCKEFDEALDKLKTWKSLLGRR